TIVVFLILHLAPGEPVDLIVGPNATPEVYENVKISLGLDRPLPVQYFIFMKNLLRGDLGRSILQRRPVSELLIQRFPITLKIGLYSLLLSFAVAIPIGIHAAINKNTATDYLSMTAALIGISMPTFLLGLLLIYFFSYKLGWFPISGYGALNI
ncbi:MAG TPA: ABC transporter permease, partial [Clostridia bacterium]|nr:ABC transporter permease [Clostridia bacterium]